MAEKFTGLHRPELICSCWARSNSQNAGGVSHNQWLATPLCKESGGTSVRWRAGAVVLVSEGLWSQKSQETNLGGGA